jgi:hypothetical protein
LFTDELKKRVEEAEAQLREEAKIIERMSRENKSKQEQINSMEIVLQKEMEKHQATIRILEDENQTQKLQAEHEIDILRARVRELELHVEAYDVLESTNDVLRSRVEKLMNQLEEENHLHTEEIHKVRLDLFNHKMALEKTFRKALQELDTDYFKKAFNAMSVESKNALVANAKLKDELQLQSIGIDNLMQRFKEQTQKYHQLKVENEILEKESLLRLQDVSEMKKHKLLVTRQLDIGDQAENDQFQKLQKENEHLKKLLEMAQKRTNQWKQRCMEMTTTLSNNKKTDINSSCNSIHLQQQKQQKEEGEQKQQQSSYLEQNTQTTLTNLNLQDSRNYRELWSASMNGSPQTIQMNTQRISSSDPSLFLKNKMNVLRVDTPIIMETERLLSSSSSSPLLSPFRAMTAPTNDSVVGLGVVGKGRKPLRLTPSVVPATTRRSSSMDNFNFT